MTTRRQRLATLWVVVAVLFGTLLAVARSSESGLDDPDPALQRIGLLDAGRLPLPASRLTAELPRPGRRAVVFFVRPDGVAGLCRALVAGDLERADLVIVVSGPGRCGGVPTIADGSGRLAAAYGLRRPRDGGPPVGYAIVDRRGQVRYRTLDPSGAAGLSEVETIVAATR